MTVYGALACISAGAALVFVGRAAWAFRARWTRTEAQYSGMDKETAAYVAECFKRYRNESPPVKSRGRRFDYYAVVDLLKRACSERDAVIAAVMGRDGGAAALGTAVERAKQLRQERFQLIEAILGTPAATAVERGVPGAVAVARAHKLQRERREMLGGPDPEGRWGPPADALADVERAADALRKAEEAEPSTVERKP